MFNFAQNKKQGPSFSKQKFLGLVKKSKGILLIILMIVFWLPQVTEAQNIKVKNMPNYDRQKYHFGFTIGVNQMHFIIKPAENYQFTLFDSSYLKDFSVDSMYLYKVEHEPTVGFTVGIVGNYRLGKFFDARFIPSLSFGERYINYRILTYKDGVDEIKEIKKNIPSTFLDLPFLLKYKSKRVNNYRGYLITGPDFRFDFASQYKREKETSITQVKLRRFDIYYDVGVGFDFYFGWFKMATELKMSYGILDVLKREQNIYTDGIDRMSSKLFQFSLLFE